MTVQQPVRNWFALCFLLVLLTAVGGGTPAWSQDSGKTKDDALDSLIEKLTVSPENAASKSDKRAASSKAKGSAKASKPDAQSSAPKQGVRGGAGSSSSAEKAGKATGAGAVSSKDQELDSLLEKLGETKDAPTPEDRPRSAGPGQKPPQPSGADKPDPAKLGGKDKDLDERLEELTGKKKKRQSSDDDRKGPVGEIIKEMRDVEQRLGKPDPSEETRNKQKQIVKRIDTLIEQVRRSESSVGRLMKRRRGQRGQQPGDQPGDEQGALARGAPATKPARPTDEHSTAGGKDIWGHLPPDMRTLMENTFKEQSLTAKAELISRYFLSVGKGKPQREE